MTLKMLWRILTTPSCWMQLYPHDKRCDELIRYLLDNKDRVTTHFAPFENSKCFFNLVLRIDGNEYSFWIRNKWYAYLSREWGILHEPIVPSRSLRFAFYDAFEKPFREKHKIDLPGPKETTFIKPEWQPQKESSYVD